MWRALTPAWIPSRPCADMLALQGFAERAGYALACPFSSSDEFEAAVIRSRRAAGAYGRNGRWRYAVCFGGVASVLLALIYMI